MIEQDSLDAAGSQARTYVTDGHIPCALVALATPTDWIGIRAFDARVEVGESLHDKRFALASISKAITGVGVARLVDQGVLDYAAPVAEYVPEFGVDEQRRRITLGDIFTHTTGLPAKSGQAGQCTADLRKLLVEDDLLSEPGTQMQYTTYTYQLINWIVERRLGQTMTEFLSEYVFEPCGMTDTSFYPDPPDRCMPAVDHPASDPDALELYSQLEMSGSGMWSTAADLVRMAQAVLTPGRLMGEETYRLVTTAQPGKPRRGTDETSCRTWGWVKEPQAAFPLQPDTGFYHGGATGTLLWLDPARDLVFVFLTNRWGSGNEHAFETLNVVCGT